MVTVAAARKLALSFPDVVEQPHFERTSFRAPKIFATMIEDEASLNLMLDPGQQADACARHAAFSPVPNKWGERGATTVDLASVPLQELERAMEQAYRRASDRKPGQKR